MSYNSSIRPQRRPFYILGPAPACAWDIAKREGPRGYGYATAELGVKIAADLNLQVLILNRLPSELDFEIFGLTVTIAGGIAATFAPFFTMIGLTLIVWIYMYIRRLRFITAENLQPDDLIKGGLKKADPKLPYFARLA